MKQWRGKEVPMLRSALHLLTLPLQSLKPRDFQIHCVCIRWICNFISSHCCLFVCVPGVTTHRGCIFHSPVAGFSLLVFEVSWPHTTTRHSRQDSSGRVISLSQRPLPDNTQHSQQTNIHAPGGIRTHDLRRRAAEDLRLRPRGHWDRHISSHWDCVVYERMNWRLVCGNHRYRRGEERALRRSSS